MAWISTGNGTNSDWILSTDRMQINQSPYRWAGVDSSKIYTLSYT